LNDIVTVNNTVSNLINNSFNNEIFLGTNPVLFSSSLGNKDADPDLTVNNSNNAYSLNSISNPNNAFSFSNISFRDDSEITVNKENQKNINFKNYDSTLDQVGVFNSFEENIELPVYNNKNSLNSQIGQTTLTKIIALNPTTGIQGNIFSPLPVAGIDQEGQKNNILGSWYNAPTTGLGGRISNKARALLNNPSSKKLSKDALDRAIQNNIGFKGQAVLATPLTDPTKIVDNLISSGTFTIQIAGSKDKPFLMDLMPAIESKIKSGVAGQDVPGLKPGLYNRTSLSVAKFAIPGGAPIVQIMGLNTTVVELCGLFLSTEREKEFKSSIIDKGKRTIISIEQTTGISLNYAGIIMDYTTQIARQDRVYYCLKLMITDYGSAACVRTVETPNGTAISNLDVQNGAIIVPSNTTSGSSVIFKPTILNTVTADITQENINKAVSNITQENVNKAVSNITTKNVNDFINNINKTGLENKQTAGQSR
jgi:hypothetical protein